LKNPLDGLVWPAGNPFDHALIRMDRSQFDFAMKLAALRPEVVAFALLMEGRLSANDHKGGWKDDRPESLLRACQTEIRELSAELLDLNTHRVFSAGEGPNKEHHLNELRLAIARVGHEAADVGNFAMMVADVAGSLKL
jgi:hypothetical protein